MLHTEIQVVNWRRVGAFDLPQSLDFMTIDPEGHQAQGWITLSNQRLHAAAFAGVVGR
jgi:hypothetical protein